MLVLHRVLAALTICLLFGGVCPAAEHPRHRIASPAVSPEDLYSRRALRRARLIIELRLLELRKERLECVRRAILRNLPPDLRPRDDALQGTRPLDPETCAQLFL